MQIIATTERWGIVDLTEQVAAWSFTTRDGVGYAEAQVTVRGPERLLWVLVEHSATDTLEFRDGDECYWRGYLSSPTLKAGQIELLAEGVGLRMRDVGTWRVFSDTNYAHWMPGVSLPDEFPEGMGTSTNEGLAVTARGSYSDGDEVTLLYPATGLSLGAALVRWRAHLELVITSGDWVAELRDDSGAVLWSAAVTTSTDVDLTVGSAAGLVVALRKNGAGTGEARLVLTENVAQTLDPATVTAVVELLYLAAGIPLGRLEAGMEVVCAAWQQESRLQALQAMAALGDGTQAYRAGVYEAGELAAWGTTPDWELRRADLADWALAWQRDGVYNAVKAALPDGWMSDWVEDADSIARWGWREMVLQLQQTTRAEAESQAALYLADHAYPPAALTLGARSRARTPDGAWCSAYRIRAGDALRLRDLLPDQDVLIDVAETRADASGIQITPRGTDNRLETLLAAQEQRFKGG